MIPDAWGWCTETTQKDGTGRGVRMGEGKGNRLAAKFSFAILEARRQWNTFLN